ncbi:MAG: ShlB/FhaC/HecB family hemolysin secretion/activation protein [Candidatus Accumulibacter sp.]|jgi:hemolysin activation/secretion protein|nr:ShlB/FhaC/HecB family hemolysin secretion/activation protein [Accumulibacter sp.]
MNQAETTNKRAPARTKRRLCPNAPGAAQRLAALLLCLVAFPLQAQTPDTAAREIQRQQERERALQERLDPRPDVRLPAGRTPPPDRLPATESPCFTIREIRLDDPSGRFAWALDAADPEDDPATGRCLGAQGINRVMARIQNAIIEHGYVTTRVLAENQDLTAGRLTLKILPGRLRAIRPNTDPDARLTVWNALPASPGDILNLRDLEQALENWKRLSTVEADIRIAPGGEPGESDLILDWKQAFPIRLTLSANDGGSKTTGRYQGSLTVSAENFLALNDLLYLTLNHDLGGGKLGEYGTRGKVIHYSMPVGYWMLAATGSEHRYRQTVAGASQDYLYSGVSETAEIKLSRLIHRNAAHKSTIWLRGYLTRSRNAIDGVEITVQRRRMAGWEAGIQHRAFLANGGTLDMELAWRKGSGAFSALRAPEDAFGEGTARPKIVTAQATLSLPLRLLGQTLRYDGHWRAQWNRTPLVAQDRFSIGGRYTVRGYDGESVLMAERGYLIRNEISLPFADKRQEAYAGIDHGRVGGRTAELLVGRSLTGAVLGVRGHWKGISYDLFAGRPIRRPSAFKTDSVTAGFNLTMSY